MVLPRVGESVEFDGVSFTVLQLIHKFKLGTAEQTIYVYIKEIK